MVFVRKKDGISALSLAAETREALEQAGITTVGALIDVLEKESEALAPLGEGGQKELQRWMDSLGKGSQGYALVEWGAALPTKRGRLVWSLDEDGTLAIRGTGAMMDCIPSRPAPWQDFKEEILTLQVEEGVTQVGAQAFRDCTRLSRVTLAHSVERVGMAAFAGCTALEEVSAPRRFRHVRAGNKVVEREQTIAMGSRAFDGTPWAKRAYGSFYIDGGVLVEFYGEEQEVVIPEGVREIAPLVFENRPIRSVRLPETLEVIRRYAFQGTRLEELTLPAGVKLVEGWAFAETKGLKNVTLLNKEVDMPPEAFAGSPVYPSARRVRGRWRSFYSLSSAKEAGMGEFKRLVVKRNSARTVGVPYFDARESLLRKLKRGDMVFRICLNEAEKRVKYVQAFAHGRDGYFTQLMYPCVKDGEVDIWQDSTTYLDYGDILSCDTSGLWPLDEKGCYRWYWKKYQPYDEYDKPLVLLWNWLKKHPEYRVDTIGENLEQAQHRILVPC